MTDGSVVRRMFRQAGVAAVTCVTGLLTAGTSAALALELKQPSIDGYCMANGSGERNRYVVELGGHVNGQSNGDGTENVEEYRVRVTVRLRERFGGRWNKPAVRTLTSELQSTLDETHWPLFKRRYSRKAGRRLKEVKGTAALTLLTSSGSVADTAGPFRFHSVYDPRIGMEACQRGGAPVSSG